MARRRMTSASTVVPHVLAAGPIVVTQGDSMQVLVQVVCKRGLSMRDAIARHPQLEEHRLKVIEQKRPGRSRGWTKVRSTEPGRHGAINLEWDADTNILVSRVVTRGHGKPNLIIGDYVDFLLRRFPARIQAINIIPRK